MSTWPNKVTIGGFVADNNTSDFRVTARVGGWGTAPIRLDMQERSQQSGAWDSSPVYGSRVITVEGTVVQPSHAAAQSVADALCALDLRRLHDLVVTNEAVGPRTVTARLEVGAEPEWFGEDRFRYTIQLRAADPLKYGPRTFAQTGLSSATPGAGLVYPLAYPINYGIAPGSTPGSLPVANNGTASYLPNLRIDGPVLNPVVSMAGTGDLVRFNGTVATGQWLDIDCARRRVLLSGQVSQRHRVSFVGAWLAVPVGGGTVTWTADNADPAATLSVWGYEGAWL